MHGLFAALALLAVTAGVPWALFLFVGNQLPTSVPDRGWLNAELSAGAVLDVLAVVLWLVWAHFVLCVLAEFRAWTAGRNSSRVPFGGANQALAQRLVAAVLLLGAGAVWVAPTAPVTSLAAALQSASVASTSLTSATESGAARIAEPVEPAGQDVPEAGWNSTAAGAAASVAYTVHPPQGRHHDCLWDIAERTLGDPLRYHEIFELNKDRVQPDGSRLVDADLIRPGWVLLLPADAVGAATTPVTPAPVTPPAQEPAPTSGAGSQDSPSDGGGTLTQDEVTSRAFLSGGLLLAGVLVALRSRSGAQDVADETAGADPERAQFLDRALRQLAAARTDSGLPLPDLVAAHLSADELVLHLGARLDGAAAVPPRPWTVLEGGAWRIRCAELPDGPHDAVAAPYPALVDVAGSGGHEILVDLESAPGLVAVGGHVDTARDVVTSMAVELATNSWSDGIDVHLVGFGDELSALNPQNLHAHALLEELLQRLERAAVDTPADLLAGRLARTVDRSRPTVVVLSGPPAEDQAHRLHALTSGGRTPVGVLCVGDVATASWRFAVTADGRLDLGVLGLQGTARRLPPAEYEPWLAALRAGR